MNIQNWIDLTQSVAIIMVAVAAIIGTGRRKR